MSLSDGTGLRDECAATVVRTQRKPRFAIFYSDGSVIEDDGENVEIKFTVPKKWIEAPRDGVQSVACIRSDGRMQVLENRDIYVVMQNGEPIMTNDLGAMMRSLGLAKYGLWIPDQEYFTIREAVREYRREWEKEKNKN